jgi:nitrogen PTS system EIIA component
MDLEIKDVADLLNVSETTVRGWLDEGKIPAYRIQDQYRFSRFEIEDWVLNHSFDEEMGDLEMQKGGTKQFSLYRAIHKGSLIHQMPGKTKEEIIIKTAQLMAKDLELDAEVVADLLLDRERQQPTALNNGIAVPHTRDLLLNAHYDVVTLVFPEEPIPYGALDGKPVHTLFFLFASEDTRHLHLLAKIAHLSSQPDSYNFLLTKPNKANLLRYIMEWENSISSR